MELIIDIFKQSYTRRDSEELRTLANPSLHQLFQAQTAASFTRIPTIILLDNVVRSAFTACFLIATHSRIPS
jgi:hypothetical protein